MHTARSISWSTPCWQPVNTLPQQLFRQECQDARGNRVRAGPRGVKRSGQSGPLPSSSPRVPPCGGTTRCHRGPLWDLSWDRSDYPSLAPRVESGQTPARHHKKGRNLSERQVERGLPGVALKVPPPSGGCGSPLQRSGCSQESGLSRDTDGRRKTEGC